MHKRLHWYILAALVLGVIAGSITQNQIGAENVRDSEIGKLYEFVGSTVFVGLLKMVIVPLIFSSIVTGIASLGTGKGFGRLGMKTLLYYMSTSVLAILIGLTLVNVIQPGLVDGKPNPALKAFIDANREKFEADGKKIGENAEAVSARKPPLGVIGEIVARMIPQNIVLAASDNGAMLSLILVSLLVAFGLIHTKGEGRDALLNGIRGLNDLMIKITGWIMLLAPLGVFGLMAFVIAQTGPGFLKDMARYMVTVLIALAIHMFVVLPLMLFLFGRVHPWRHFKAMKDALLMSFSTASSSATLPVTMRCIQDNAGVSKRTSSFVLPLGATVNMDGTALYECVAVLFVAQIMGAALGLGEQVQILVLALATSVGVAGVPSASLVAIVIIIQNVAEGQPWGAGAMAAIGAIYAVDRVLDMCRTSVNIFSDSCGAVIIAKSEGEDGVLANPEPASGTGMADV